MSTTRKVWGPQVLSNTSFGFPIGLEFSLVQVFGKNRKTDATIVEEGLTGERNLFVALFDQEDVDFEIGIKNHSQWNVEFRVDVGKSFFAYIIERGVEASMKALTPKGKHLHFLSQETDDGKSLVAMSAKRSGTTYEEAAINCSRMKFLFALEKCEKEIALETAVERTFFENQLRLRHRYPKDLEMAIRIETFTGKVVPLKVYPQDEISFIKKLYEEKEGVPVDNQRFIYTGKQLEDGKTLSDYNIEPGATLCCALRLLGGGTGPVRGVVCFGEETDQRFGVYNKTFINSAKYALQGFTVELRKKPKYSISP